VARPRANLPDAAALIALLDDQDRMSVRVTPGARSEALTIEDGQVFAKVRAKPQDGKANDAVRDLLAAAFDMAPSRIELLRGATSREKVFRLAR